MAYHLDERYCHLLPKGNAQLQQDFVRRSLVKYKPTNCNVLSEGERYDQQYLSVEVALEEIVSAGPTSLVLFVPAQAAYLEGHEPRERYLCLREKKYGGNS